MTYFEWMNTMFIEIDIKIIIKNSEDIMANFKFGIIYFFYSKAQSQ